MWYDIPNYPDSPGDASHDHDEFGVIYGRGHTAQESVLRKPPNSVGHWKALITLVYSVFPSV